MNKKITAVIVVLLLMVAGVGGYIYYKRTPTYTFNLIQDAVKEHDWDKFSRHVDVKELSESAFDDLMAEALNQDKTMDSGTKAIATGFVQMFKPMVVNAIESGLKEYVENGEVKKSEDNKSPQEQQGEQAADNLIQNTRAKEVSFTGVKSTDIDSGTATVTLDMRNEKLGKDFELKISMSQLEDGSWKVHRVSNFKEFMQEVKKAEEAKLAEINKPMQDEIDQAVKVSGFSGQIRQDDDYGFSFTLLLSGTAEIRASKALESFSGYILVTNPAGAVSTGKYMYKANGSTTGTEKMELSKSLNLFGDSELIKAQAQGYKFDATVTELMYQDGSEVKLLDKLPE